MSLERLRQMGFGRGSVAAQLDAYWVCWTDHEAAWVTLLCYVRELEQLPASAAAYDWWRQRRGIRVTRQLLRQSAQDDSGHNPPYKPFVRALGLPYRPRQHAA